MQLSFHALGNIHLSFSYYRTFLYIVILYLSSYLITQNSKTAHMKTRWQHDAHAEQSCC